MAKFNFYQDTKCTIWERVHFQIEAETEEEARAMAAKFADTGSDVADSDATIVNITDVDGTREYMYPEENDGQATVEVWFDDPTKEENFVASNGN